MPPATLAEFTLSGANGLDYFDGQYDPIRRWYLTHELMIILSLPRQRLQPPRPY